MWTAKSAIVGIIAGAACLMQSGCASTAANRDAIAAQINFGVTRAVDNVRESRSLTRAQIDKQTESLKTDARYNLAAALSAAVTALIAVLKQHAMAKLVKGSTNAKPD